MDSENTIQQNDKLSDHIGRNQETTSLTDNILTTRTFQLKIANELSEKNPFL